MALKRRFCEHCKEFVSLRTYREHVALYFNKKPDQWQEIESSDDENLSLHGEALGITIHDNHMYDDSSAGDELAVSLNLYFYYINCIKYTILCFTYDYLFGLFSFDFLECVT